MAKGFDKNPDQRADQMKGQGPWTPNEGEVASKKHSMTTGPNSAYDKDPGVPKGSSKRDVGD